jgi:anti-sigma B factor antagonist
MGGSGGLGLDLRGERSHPVLALDGELDIGAAPRVQDAVTQLCRDGVRRLTLDLSRLEFIDSSGLAAVVYVSRQCERHGCELELVPGIDSVQRVFEVAGLAALLPFCATPVGDGV